MGIEISDAALLQLFRLSPFCVPIPLIGRCLGLLGQDEEKRRILLASLPRRRARAPQERRTLAALVQHRRGAVAAIDPAAMAQLIDQGGGFGVQPVH